MSRETRPVTEHPPTSAPYVVALTEPEAADPALAGGKGANLARLVAAGLPVPEGFCVTTVAFQRLIDDESIRTQIRELSTIDPTDTAAIADAGATLRDRIRAREVPDEVREAITRALAATPEGPAGAYAVRSSATAEDLPEASFAGQQETFLNVPESEVVDRVRACMASLFTDRAIAYRARNDIPHEDVALSAVVQRMVDADTSGILFTADPTTGNRRVAAIEAGRGLGEALVSGEVTADTVRVDRRIGRVVDYEVGDQRVAVRPRAGGGTETAELPGDDTARVLSDEEIRALMRLAAAVETLFERPQDVEWCIADGEAFLVQARPITSLFPLPTPAPSDDRLHVYYSIGHAQAFAEAMPPLVRDIWTAYVDSAFTAFGFAAGSHVGVEAGGRVYVDITTPLRIGVLRNALPDLLAATSEPMGAALADVLRRRSDEFRSDRTVTGTLAALPRLASAAWEGGRLAFPLASKSMDGFVGAFVGEPNAPEYEEAMWVEWGEEMEAQVTAHDTLTERVRSVFDLFGTIEMMSSFPRAGPLFAALAVDGWLRRLFPDAPEDVNAVGRGFPHELVTRLNLGLGDLADVARDHPALADALLAGASLDEIATLDGGDAFVAAFERYLEEFGHRATGELDISRPRWREDPSGLLATVRANLELGEKGEHRAHLRRMEREATAAAERLERRADRGRFGPVRRRVVRQLITTFRGYIQTREYPKQGTAYLFTAWRGVCLEAGERLVAEGRLARPEDVWFLRKDELLAALDGAPVTADIDARRDEFERQAAMDAPPVLTSEGEAPSPRVERDDVPAGAFVGTGVSGGVVEGVARVVRDPSAETVEKGEILIAPSSDPGWTPLFLNAAGMVVEVGGRMSHGALVAREYGIPAVASVPGVTRQVRTGQRVRVDGTRGIVEILD
jgi:phosphohistidine swiveling domain-containing protein